MICDTSFSFDLRKILVTLSVVSKWITLVTVAGSDKEILDIETVEQPFIVHFFSILMVFILERTVIS